MLWGGVHGSVLAAYWAFRDRVPTLHGLGRSGRAVLGVTGWALTIALVGIAWVFFRAAGAREAVDLLGVLLGVAAAGPTALSSLQRAIVLAAASATLAVEGLQEWRERRGYDRIATTPAGTNVLAVSWRG